MLTVSEREWLDLRPYNGTAWCWHCPNYGADCALSSKCPFNENWKDVAEFSERVAAELAKIYEELDHDYGCHDCPVWHPCHDEHKLCREVILKYARLMVEEEMDAVSCSH